MESKLKEFIRISKRIAGTLGWVALLTHSTLVPLARAQDDFEDGDVVVGSGPGAQSAADFEAQQQENLSNAQSKDLFSAATGGGVGGSGSTIGQLKAEHKRTCSNLHKAADANAYGTSNNTGALDAAALGQKQLLCELTRTAIKNAEIERVMQIAFTVALASCVTACAASATPAAPVLHSICKYLDIGASVGSALAEALLGNDVQAAMSTGINAVTKASRGGERFGGTLLGTAIEFGKDTFGKGKDAATEFKPKTKAEVDKMNPTEKAEYDKAQKKADSDQKKKESCGAIPMLTIEMTTHMIKKGAAKRVARDTLDGIAKLNSLNHGAAGLNLSAVESGIAKQRAIADPTMKAKAAGGAAVAGGDGSGEFAAICSGSSPAATFNCMREQAFPGAGPSNPLIDEMLNKSLPAGFEDWDPLNGQAVSDEMVQFSGVPVQFGPIIDKAQKHLESKLEASKSASLSSEASYGQSSGERAPAAEVDPLEAMMANLLGGMDKPKEEAGPTFDRDLEFRYAKDARGLADDPKVSLFRRVSFRYRAVDKRTGFAGNAVAPKH